MNKRLNASSRDITQIQITSRCSSQVIWEKQLPPSRSSVRVYQITQQNIEIILPGYGGDKNCRIMVDLRTGLLVILSSINGKMRSVTANLAIIHTKNIKAFFCRTNRFFRPRWSPWASLRQHLYSQLTNIFLVVTGL